VGLQDGKIVWLAARPMVSAVSALDCQHPDPYMRILNHSIGP
jgi:hypothetical protein